MIIVGISGQIGSGKTTLADFFCQADPEHSAHLETSTVIIDLANQFNALIVAAGGQFDYTLDATNRLLIDFLPYLQPMAPRKIGLNDIALDIDDVTNKPQWYEKLFEYYKHAQADPSLLGGTIDAHNKAKYRELLQWIGGYFLYRIDPVMWYRELSRRVSKLPPSVNFVALTAPRQPAEAEYVKAMGGHSLLIERPEHQADTSDVTENRVSEITFDIRVINDGTLEQLARLAAELQANLRQESPATVYTASTF